MIVLVFVVGWIVLAVAVAAGIGLVIRHGTRRPNPLGPPTQWPETYPRTPRRFRPWIRTRRI